MAKTVPTALVVPDIGRFTSGEAVTLFDWDRLNEALNYHYARQGAHVGGMVFDPAWTSLDFGAGGNVYHTANQTAGKDYDLDDWTGVFRFARPMFESGSGATGFEITLDIFAENLDVRATLFRIDGGNGTLTSASTAFTTLVASTATGDSEHVTAALGFTPAQAARGGAGAALAEFFVILEAKVPAAGTGNLWYWALRETVLTGASLPRI